MWDDREQCEQFRARFDDVLERELQRITDAAVLRKEQDAGQRECERQAKETAQREQQETAPIKVVIPWPLTEESRLRR